MLVYEVHSVIKEKRWGGGQREVCRIYEQAFLEADRCGGIEIVVHYGLFDRIPYGWNGVGLKYVPSELYSLWFRECRAFTDERPMCAAKECVCGECVCDVSVGFI